ncbi:PfkB family carbohydrate kinase [Lichenicoccus sp.]|uniref:PfkB family carbohydrate kinase n=1 Tax=Lichenicoccus sp. TaxID=2781899 RepID=UPI003D0D02A9
MSQVLVLGNAGIDLLLPVTRLPRPGETLMARGLTRAPGGKGLNQAVVAARAGAAVAFCAAIGDDPDGRLVAQALTSEHLASLQLISMPHCTDLSVVLVGEDAENSIVSAGPCADSLDAVAAAEFALGVGPGDVLLMQGNLSQAATLAAARAAAEREARVVLNLAPLRWPASALLPHCNVIVANKGEAGEITGCTDPRDAALRLHALGPAFAVVTLGGAGCVCASGGGLQIWPSKPARVVDTTGAGDTFCGVFGAALALGRDVAEAVNAAQAAAAITVSRPGAFAALPWRAELAPLMA